MLLRGVELNPEQSRLAPEERHLLPVLAAALPAGQLVVKTRWPNPAYLRSVNALVPGVQFLTRPATEGYTRAEITEGYFAFLVAFQDGGLVDQWLAHEVANEPNHSGGPWGAEGATRYWRQLRPALVEIFPQLVTALVSPGLQPHNGTAAWAAMLDTCPEFGFRGAHAYWQGDRVSDGLADALAQAGDAEPGRVIVTEFGDSSLVSQGYGQDDSLTVRAGRCAEALRTMAARGFKAGVLFLLHSSNDAWRGFVYPERELLGILGGSVAGLPPRPEARFGEGFARALTARPGLVPLPGFTADQYLTSEVDGEAHLAWVPLEGQQALVWLKSANTVALIGPGRAEVV